MDRTSTTLGIGGNIYGGLEKLTHSNGYWLGKNGKYYKTSWGGNGWTGSRAGALKLATKFKWAGGVTAVIAGGIDIGLGIREDGGFSNIGYNTGKAAAGTAGGIGGASLGAWIGGVIGSPFAGVGAIPGAVVGGVIGGWIGGWGGSEAGEAIYDGFVK